ncbi:hypothetical protein Syun_008078 [Stephania yunnanensis]|uniref:Trichome birefringence-like N-terminal domain-containing protein n=1 Tax=Stephania yunnanensis TaxID=152371 RepID=A0AAP0PZ32_9MAGN
MERQRSFSFKPTRLLLFSFTISSSLLFFTFFSIWVFKAAPSIPKETHVMLNTSSLNLGLKPIKAHALTGFFLTNLTHEGTSEDKDSVLGDGHVKNGVLESTHYAKSGGNQISFDGSSENASVVVGTRSVERNISGDQKGGLGSAHYAKSGDFSKKGFGALDGERVGERRRDECDVSQGKWVYDESYPLYTSNSCPFVDEGFSCESNGRTDRDYIKWRWQPHHCNTPR